MAIVIIAGTSNAKCFIVAPYLLRPKSITQQFEFSVYNDA